MSDVFISYSRKDKDFAARLQAALVEHEREPWLDTKDIPPTAEWLQEIYGAIEKADSFVFVMSPEALSSEVCQRELAHAVEHHKRLIPVVRRDVDPKDVPDLLARLNWIFCRDGEEFSQSFQALLTAMATDLDHVRAHTRLLLKALEWEGRGRDKSLLLRGGELKRAEEWLTEIGDKEPRPTPLMLQFLGASRKGATARQRLTLGAVSFALVVAVSLALAAFYQYREARSQKESALARGLAAQSELLRSQQHHLLGRSVLLAVESLRRRRTLEGSLALQRGLALLPKRLASLKREKEWHQTAISPDGALLAGWTESIDNKAPRRLWIWETKSGHLVTSLPEVETDYLLVAFTPDSKRLVTLTGAGNLRVINAADGQEVAEKGLGHDILRKVALSPDGRLIAMGGNHQVIVYELSTWKEVARLPYTKWLGKLVFTPDGSQLAVSCDDGTIKLWQVKKATPLASFKDVYHVGSFVVSPDGQYLAAGTGEAVPTEDTEIWVCHLPTRRVTARLPSKGPCDGLEFSQNGLLMTAAADGVAVWRPQDGKEVFRVQPSSSNAAALSADGHWLAVGAGAQAVQVYDLTSGKEVRRLSHPHLGGVFFSPDSRWLYTWGQGGAIRWQVDRFQEVVVLPHQKQTFNPIDFTFSPDGRLLATSDADEDAVYLWENATGCRLFSLDRLAIFQDVPRFKQIHSQWDVGVFSPDSKWLVLKQRCRRNLESTSTGEVASETALGIFDPATGKLVSRVTGLGDYTSVSFRPDGQTLMTEGGDGGRKVWDLATGALRESIPPPVLPTNLQDKKGVFSPDGQWFCGVGRDQIRRVWEASSGKELFQLGPEPQYPKYLKGIFSNNAKYLAATEDIAGGGRENLNPVLVWEVPSGRQVASVPQPQKHVAPAFDPASHILAVVAQGNLVHLIHLAQSHELARLRHEAEVTAIAFSNDGRWLASASKDHTARVWDSANGKELARLEHPGEVLQVVFSPDGRRLATSCLDGQVRLWYWRLDDLMAAACARLSRNFTREEWREYLGDEPYRLTCPDLPVPEK
jgi:WD40 repeat protein